MERSTLTVLLFKFLLASFSNLSFLKTSLTGALMMSDYCFSLTVGFEEAKDRVRRTRCWVAKLAEAGRCYVGAIIWCGAMFSEL